MSLHQKTNPIPWIVICVIVLIFLIAGGLWGCPKYNVWEQGLKGQAELKRAEQNRQIRINEAMAKDEAATFEAAAEIKRAHGVAEANKIISGSLAGDAGSNYLRYRYIVMLEETGGAGRETIYIATEAGMPILEAGRFNDRSPVFTSK